MRGTKEGQNRLMDQVRTTLILRNDAELARKVGVAPPVISKIRHAKLGVPDGMLIKFHEMTGMRFSEMREILGIDPIHAQS